MFKSRAAKVALVLVLAFVLFGLLMGLILSRFLGGRGPRVLPASVLLHQVQTLSQLVTVKYVLEKVVILEDVKWIAGLGENKVLMVAHGTVKAGLDLSQLEPGDVKVSGKKVTLRLPKAQITDA